jgi:hypothetical protein
VQSVRRERQKRFRDRQKAARNDSTRVAQSALHAAASGAFDTAAVLQHAHGLAAQGVSDHAAIAHALLASSAAAAAAAAAGLRPQSAGASALELLNAGLAAMPSRSNGSLGAGATAPPSVSGSDVAVVAMGGGVGASAGQSAPGDAGAQGRAPAMAEHAAAGGRGGARAGPPAPEPDQAPAAVERAGARAQRAPTEPGGERALARVESAIAGSTGQGGAGSAAGRADKQELAEGLAALFCKAVAGLGARERVAVLRAFLASVRGAVGDEARPRAGRPAAGFGSGRGTRGHYAALGRMSPGGAAVWPRHARPPKHACSRSVPRRAHCPHGDRVRECAGATQLRTGRLDNCGRVGGVFARPALQRPSFSSARRSGREHMGFHLRAGVLAGVPAGGRRAALPAV